MSKINISEIIITIVTNGFIIDKTERYPTDNLILNIKKYDKLGAEVRYSILFTNSKKESNLILSLKTISTGYLSTPIVVCDNFTSAKYTTYTFDEFYSFFGGIVNTGLILISNLPDILDSLGKNKTPQGLEGDASNLHEIYVKECFQYMLQLPTRHFGQERLFQSVPDGIVISTKGMTILYDSKSYSNGFNFTSDDIKRFASYVEDFNTRYSREIGNVFSFTVVTGKFNIKPTTIQKRSNELYSKCMCKMSCITSREFGDIIQILKIDPHLRTSIPWKKIFSELIIDKALINKEISRIKNDNIY
jgi:hypothetical protein